MSLDFPDSPVDGQQSNQPNGVTYQWNATKGRWEAITAGYDYIGSTAPVGAKEGARWWDNETGRSYIYYIDSDGGQWVEEDPQHIVAVAEGQPLEVMVNGTPQGSLVGGSTVSFPIPSGVKKFSVSFLNVSFSAAAAARIVLKTLGSPVTTGYASHFWLTNDANGGNPTTDVGSTNGAFTHYGIQPAETATMTFECTLVNQNTNFWSYTLVGTETTGNQMLLAAGNVPLTTELDGIDINASAGTYQGGTINIQYENPNAKNLLSGVIVTEGSYTVGFWDNNEKIGGNQSPTVVTGYYHRIGRLVFVRIRSGVAIDVTGLTGTNVLFFDLPFTVSDESGTQGHPFPGSAIIEQVGYNSANYVNPIAVESFKRGWFRTSRDSQPPTNLSVNNFGGVGVINGLTLTYTTDDP